MYLNLDRRTLLSRPVRVDPVKETFRILGCSARSLPVSPSPDKTCIRPSGNPASLVRLARMQPLRGAFSDDLMIMALPAFFLGKKD